MKGYLKSILPQLTSFKLLREIVWIRKVRQRNISNGDKALTNRGRPQGKMLFLFHVHYKNA